MHLILVRHGRTHYNAQRRFQGHAQIPLDPNGRKQAQLSAQIILNLVGTASSPKRHCREFRCSDLLRAAQSAEAIYQTLRQAHPVGTFSPWPQEITWDPNLREIACGELEHYTAAEYQSKFPGKLEQYLKEYDENPRHAKYPGPGSESRQDLMNRIRIVFDDLTSKRFPSSSLPDCVVWCTHGGTIDGILEHLEIALPGKKLVGNSDVLLLEESDLKKYALVKHFNVGQSVAARIVPDFC